MHIKDVLGSYDEMLLSVCLPYAPLISKCAHPTASGCLYKLQVQSINCMMDAVGRMLIDGKSPLSIYVIVFKWEEKHGTKDLQLLCTLSLHVSRTELYTLPIWKITYF